jgi:glyoxylase-like metal-dependent hydrolase (beta-lactamase superfamily II)
VPAIEFTRGLHHLAGSCHAWLEPDGSWRWSNAGLVVGVGESLLFDTLFDVPMTQAMLDGMGEAVSHAPITMVVNSHSNGDHWFGNQLFPDTAIVASAATAAEMTDAGPDMIAGLREAPGAPGRFAREIFAPFDWTDCHPLRPTETFSGRRDIDVGGVMVELHELGPAHTAGDTVAFVPSTGVLYTGDLVFVGGTPIIWAGPLRHWVEACDTMVGLEPVFVVPGHGPVTDTAGIHQVRDYLLFVEEEATRRFHAGMDPTEAMRDIALGRFGEWAESGRIAQNVMAVYLELDPTLERPTTRGIFSRVAALEGYED